MRLKWLLLFSMFLCAQLGWGQLDTAYIYSLGTGYIDNTADVIISKDSTYVVLFNSSTSQTQGNIGVVELDKNFEIIRSLEFSTSEIEVGKSILQLEDSCYVISGYHNKYGGGGYDGFILKLDVSFNKIWERSFGGIGWDFFHSSFIWQNKIVAIGESNQKCGSTAFMVVFDLDNGNIISTQYLCEGETSVFYDAIRVNQDFYLVGKINYGDSLVDQILITDFDSLLTLNTLRSFGQEGNESALGIDKNQKRELIISGFTSSDALSLEGKEDFYVLLLDSTFNVISDRTYGSSGDDRLVQTMEMQNGSYAMLGTSDGPFGQGGFGMRLIQTDSDLNFNTGPTFGGVADEKACCLTKGLDSGLVFFGSSTSYDENYGDIYIIHLPKDQIDFEYELKINQQEIIFDTTLVNLKSEVSNTDLSIFQKNKTLEVSTSSKVGTFILLNSNGTLIRMEKVFNGKNKFELGSISNGIYFYNYSDNKGNFKSGKLFINGE